jgi:3-phenylpropionate/trans-cinnamate dioxygenase ferredoxin reductase subunit
MPNYKYLIIGGGITADAAVAGIRTIDNDGSIGIISEEKNAPYNRPPLSKGLWKGKPLEKIFRQEAKKHADLHLGKSAETIDPQHKLVVDNSGNKYSYDKLLLATGGTPRRLPFGGDEIIYFRTLDDFHKLHQLTRTKSHFAVIGGGFIGSEIAAILAEQDQDVTMLFPEEGIGSLLFPADMVRYLNEYYQHKGVDVLAGEMVNGIEKTGAKFKISSRSGLEIIVDHIVAGIGIVPNTNLAQSAGIETDNGILVNENLQTNLQDIYAAGDVANIYNPVLDLRRRVEHEDNALSSGSAAGMNMAGKNTPYEHMSTFYSDMFELGYEAVGLLSPNLETFADWVEPYKKGVIYYLDRSVLKGILLWNVWNRVDAARELIINSGPTTPEQLKGSIT